MIRINESNEIEVYNVIPVYRGNRVIKFLTSVSMQDIVDVYDRIEYDADTQRGERLKKRGKRHVVEKIVNRDNIREMKDKIVNDFFDGGSLVWNVRVNNVEDRNSVVDFVPEENKIIIKSEKITLPDSAQRHMAIYGLKDYSLSLNQSQYCFPLSICLYTFTEEQSLFSEINGEGSKACKTRALYLSNQFKSVIVKEIIKESNLRDIVDFTSNSVHTSDKSVSFSTLYSSLFDKRDGAYRDVQDEEMHEFKKWMIKFYNHLIEIRSELDASSKEEKLDINNKLIILSGVSWYAFAQVSRLVRGDSNWRRRISRLTTDYKIGQWEGDIFSIENPIWKGTICTQDKHGKWKVNNNRRSYTFSSDIIKKHLNLV